MIDRRMFLRGLVAGAAGLLIPERRVWALDQTMIPAFTSIPYWVPQWDLAWSYDESFAPYLQSMRNPSHSPDRFIPAPIPSFDPWPNESLQASYRTSDGHDINVYHAPPMTDAELNLLLDY